MCILCWFSHFTVTQTLFLFSSNLYGLKIGNYTGISLQECYISWLRVGKNLLQIFQRYVYTWIYACVGILIRILCLIFFLLLRPCFEVIWIQLLNVGILDEEVIFVLFLVAGWLPTQKKVSELSVPIGLSLLQVNCCLERFFVAVID